MGTTKAVWSRRSDDVDGDDDDDDDDCDNGTAH